MLPRIFGEQPSEQRSGAQEGEVRLTLCACAVNRWFLKCARAFEKLFSKDEFEEKQKGLDEFRRKAIKKINDALPPNIRNVFGEG
jgi:hypothetical protein